ncbi:hypothetical protein BESB_071300 [Besnoitia besnoiti]|uniref:Transmembrane amino acid transporter n=1 Tax=Besnoitia besnoiti TaxID=94643 RepID=A0A2A9M680_BESBE|nr:uncharacterized protein BESB_071300 [Besnoitia besnoiti]PFH33978.1 hypothetical protein BESB_071300 [Besnoitia besnoiti]
MSRRVSGVLAWLGGAAGDGNDVAGAERPAEQEGNSFRARGATAFAGGGQREAGEPERRKSFFSWFPFHRKASADDASKGRAPAFERRRKRYRTVSWKYKKSIGIYASFVFVCNQILASGLTSMPLTLIDFGWLPSLLMNLLFCCLSSMCSLLLLRSVTLIENNQNFDERFEYSATVRHFLAPMNAPSAQSARPSAPVFGGLEDARAAGGSLSSLASSASPPSARFADFVRHHAGPAPLLRHVLRLVSRRSSSLSSSSAACAAQLAESAATAQAGLERSGSEAGRHEKTEPGEGGGEDAKKGAASPDGEGMHSITRGRASWKSLLAGAASWLSLRKWCLWLGHVWTDLYDRTLQNVHGVITRAPPLLPQSFPRTFTMLLHLNTFLSTCSAALLVAYCIDCLLLRVFSFTVFVPLLPTDVNPFQSLCGALEWLGALSALLLRPVFALVQALTSLVSAVLFGQRSLGALFGPWLPQWVSLASLASSLGLDSGAAAGELLGQLQGEQEGVWLSVSLFLSAIGGTLSAPLSVIGAFFPAGLAALLQSLSQAFLNGYTDGSQPKPYAVPALPFLYALPSQTQIEEVFSGVCTPSCGADQAPAPSSLMPTALTRFFLSGGGGAAAEGLSPSVAEGSSGPTNATPSLPGGDSTAGACAPCVDHMGVTLGYVITAGICLHLAASDLQDNMQLQFLSFGAIIAAVFQITASAAFVLLRVSPAGLLPSLVSPFSAASAPRLGTGGVGAELGPSRTAAFGSPAHTDLTGALSDKRRLATAPEGLTGPPKIPFAPHAPPKAAPARSAASAFLSSPWPAAIVRGSGMGSLVSTFVDAYSFSNALPSWANEIKDDVPVTRTIFTSTAFSCTIYFLFGFFCAAAFPAPSASSNVLAAMLPECSSFVAVACICFFHVFALLPSVATGQISCRYDLINMAICMDKQSAFFTASTLPWLLYWLLTFSPVFALPSSLLTLSTNVLLNFAAPALVFIYALHATAGTDAFPEPESLGDDETEAAHADRLQLAQKGLQVGEGGDGGDVPLGVPDFRCLSLASSSGAASTYSPADSPSHAHEASRLGRGPTAPGSLLLPHASLQPEGKEASSPGSSPLVHPPCGLGDSLVSTVADSAGSVSFPPAGRRDSRDAGALSKAGSGLQSCLKVSSATLADPRSRGRKKTFLVQPKSLGVFGADGLESRRDSGGELCAASALGAHTRSLESSSTARCLEDVGGSTGDLLSLREGASPSLKRAQSSHDVAGLRSAATGLGHEGSAHAGVKSGALSTTSSMEVSRGNALPPGSAGSSLAPTPSGASSMGRVSGAVAGGGCARSREVQRQLHEWLQEYSRQMPDSEVAQLLQQQQKEEEEEQRRLREGEEEDSLRKKQLGNAWLRRQALGEAASGDDAEEEEPAPATATAGEGGGGGSEPPPPITGEAEEPCECREGEEKKEAGAGDVPGRVSLPTPPASATQRADSLQSLKDEEAQGRSASVRSVVPVIHLLRPPSAGLDEASAVGEMPSLALSEGGSPAAGDSGDASRHQPTASAEEERQCQPESTARRPESAQLEEREAEETYLEAMAPPEQPSGGGEPVQSAETSQLAPGEIPVEFASASEASRFVRRAVKTSRIDPAAAALQARRKVKEQQRAEEAQQRAEAEGSSQDADNTENGIEKGADVAAACPCSPCLSAAPLLSPRSLSSLSPSSPFSASSSHAAEVLGPGEIPVEFAPASAASQSVCHAGKTARIDSVATALKRKKLEKKRQLAEQERYANAAIDEPPTLQHAAAEEEVRDEEKADEEKADEEKADEEKKATDGPQDTEAPRSGELGPKRGDSLSRERERQPPPCAVSPDARTKPGAAHVEERKSLGFEVSDAGDWRPESPVSMTTVPRLSASSCDGGGLKRADATAEAEASVFLWAFVRQATGGLWSPNLRESVPSPRQGEEASRLVRYSTKCSALLQSWLCSGAAKAGQRKTSVMSNASCAEEPVAPRVAVFRALPTREQKLVATYVLLVMICFCAFAALAEDVSDVVETACVFASTWAIVLFRFLFGSVCGRAWQALAAAGGVLAGAVPPTVSAGASALVAWLASTCGPCVALGSLWRVLPSSALLESVTLHLRALAALAAERARGTVFARVCTSLCRLWTVCTAALFDGMMASQSTALAGAGAVPADGASAPEDGGDGDEGLLSFEAFFLCLFSLVVAATPLLLYVSPKRQKERKRKLLSAIPTRS